jgi:ring-1,2-phenylacetyl-CoA epoxidase subunit PaaC
VSTVASAATLDAPVRAALRRHLLTLADSKRLLGIRYSDWLLGAPSIETGIAASGMAQDEWGHARLLYAMLKDLDEDPRAIEYERPAEAYTSLDGLDRPFGDWADVVAAMVVLDGALTVALEDFAAGAYEPARTRIPKMVAEEAFHTDLGFAWLRRLAGGTETARRRAADAVNAVLPRTVAWLEAADAPSTLLADAGLTGAGSHRVERLRERTREVLAAVGVTIDDVVPHIEGWDLSRARGPGAPDEEAVVRARGDLNRALFVE